MVRIEEMHAAAEGNGSLGWHERIQSRLLFLMENDRELSLSLSQSRLPTTNLHQVPHRHPDHVLDALREMFVQYAGVCNIG